MSTPKTLVIGSTRHQHVTCLAWEEIWSVNLIDFDLIVVNVRSLTNKILRKLAERKSGQSSLDSARAALARLLASGGEIIVVGAKPLYQEVSGCGVSNYAWSPINIGISEEIGTTIDVEQTVFVKYLANFKRWVFYYYLPTQWPTQELADVLGAGGLSHHVEPFRVNRYAKMLSGFILLSTTHAKTHEKEDLGRLTLLPFINELEEREAINLVLEDCLSLPQTTLPPQWADTVPMPLIPDIKAAVDEKKTAIAALNNEIEKQEQKIRDLEAFKKLLYATGVELEHVFATCLERCGGKVVPESRRIHPSVQNQSFPRRMQGGQQEHCTKSCSTAFRLHDKI